jgi:hypothetical protein
MQRRTALVIATVAVSVPLLTVGGLAVAADHIRLGPGTTATTHIGSTSGEAGERAGTSPGADNSTPNSGSSSYNGLGQGADDYGDDCAFESDRGTDPDDDCAPGATAHPDSHHDDDDDAYEDD